MRAFAAFPALADSAIRKLGYAENVFLVLLTHARSDRTALRSASPRWTSLKATIFICSWRNGVVSC